MERSQKQIFYVLNQLNDDARDSYLPIISKKGNVLELDGIALFKRCKMVDKVNPKDLFVFKLLTDNFKQGTYQFKLPGSSNTYATIENIKARTKYKMEGIVSIHS